MKRNERSIYHLPSQPARSLDDDLLSILSHDLKGPLTAIQVGVEFIRRILSNPMSDVEKRLLHDRLDALEYSASQAEGLIKSLLDAKKIESGHLVIKPQANSPIEL